MPTYTYRCTICHYEFDYTLTLEQYKPSQMCPHCLNDAPDATRVFKPTNFKVPGAFWRHKDHGWDKNDEDD